jgi:hypothetical protein
MEYKVIGGSSIDDLEKKLAELSSEWECQGGIAIDSNISKYANLWAYQAVVRKSKSKDVKIPLPDNYKDISY